MPESVQFESWKHGGSVQFAIFAKTLIKQAVSLPDRLRCPIHRTKSFTLYSGLPANRFAGISKHGPPFTHDPYVAKWLGGKWASDRHFLFIDMPYREKKKGFVKFDSYLTNINEVWLFEVHVELDQHTEHLITETLVLHQGHADLQAVGQQAAHVVLQNTKRHRESDIRGDASWVSLQMYRKC